MTRNTKTQLLIIIGFIVLLVAIDLVTDLIVHIETATEQSID
jgi:hypothetical protein